MDLNDSKIDIFTKIELLNADNKNVKNVFNEILFSDYLVSGDQVAKGASAPDLAAFRDNLFLNAFAGTGGVVEQGFFTIHILHDIKPDSIPTMHIHWAHKIASPSGNVKWQMEYSYAQGYEAGSFGAAQSLSVVQAAGAQYVHHITDDDEMILNLVGMEPDMVLVCRIFRDSADAEDTFENDAFLIQIDMHYEIGQIATLERNRPYSIF